MYQIVKRTVMKSVQAGMNQTVCAGLPNPVAIWDPMAAMTGMVHNGKP